MEDPGKVWDNSDLDEHQVAVVVYTTVRAVDFADAVGMAEKAVLRAILDAAQGTASGELEFRAPSRTDGSGPWRVPVLLSGVLELSHTARNGYVSVTPAKRMYQEISR